MKKVVVVDNINDDWKVHGKRCKREESDLR